MWRRLKNYALVLCLFTFLFIVLGAGFRLNPVAAFLAAVTGTPLSVYAFNRLTRAGTRTLSPHSSRNVAQGAANGAGEEGFLGVVECHESPVDP
jgi:hypothetical protein